MRQVKRAGKFLHDLVTAGHVRQLLIVVSLLVLVGGLVPTRVFADDPCNGLSQLDCSAIYHNWTNWVPDDGTNSCTDAAAGPTVSSSGSNKDNQQAVYAFFRGAGLDDLHAAAVYGNLYDESAGMDPTIIEGGGDSKDPGAADPHSWGLAQWLPGSRVLSIAQDNGVTGPIYELSTQLQIILKEMHGTAPTGFQNVWDGFVKTTTLADAVEYFQVHFESGDPGSRLADAQQGLKTYGGQSYTVTNGGGCASSTLSPDCQSANGVAKILCAAKAYDPASYSESLIGGHQGGAAWHASCPSINASCFVDCSGLVNMAVYDAFGVDLKENTGGERADTIHWKPISYDQLQAGDLIQPNTGHVEIVDHVVGNVIYTFGSHTSRIPQPDQVSSDRWTRDSGQLYLHYTGAGA